MLPKRTKKFIFVIVIILIAIFFVIPTIIINNQEGKRASITYDKYVNIKDKKVYSLFDLTSILNEESESSKYDVKILCDNDIVYEEKLKTAIDISEDKNIDNLKITINGSDYPIKTKQQEFEIKLVEGSNDIEIELLENDSLIKSIKKQVFFIKPYQKQFAEEISKTGINVQYRDGKDFENYELSNKQFKALGAMNARWEIYERWINKNGYDNFENYDKLLNDINDTTNIKIIAHINNFVYRGKDITINEEPEFEGVSQFIKKLQARYSNIKYYQIMNEVNCYVSYLSSYINKDDISSYSKLIEYLEKNNNDAQILTAGTALVDDKDKQISSLNFYKYMNETGGLDKCNHIAFHPYSYNNITSLRKKIEEHYWKFNEIGGFNYLDITEYGSTNYFVDNNLQAIDVVKQTVALNDKANLKTLFNLWDINENQDGTNRFGLLTHEYKPKPAYYAMKNYYQNTNGAEYIGMANIINGLEMHVYDKDGKAKVIAWAKDSNNPITIKYDGFIASDILGKKIENTSGTLKIDESPIYLDDVSNLYFYNAISNSILNGYSEFNDKFASEIQDIKDINIKIEELKDTVKKLESEKIQEKDASNIMEKHFEIGNEIIEQYKNGNLKISYTKISSMLDALNTIGNSYEDLITISAKTRMKDLSILKQSIDNVNKAIENNSNIDMIYPNKINKFATDLYETSNYVLNLEEENEIKTGLINSKALHAKYLNKWADEFSKIYLEEYYKDINNTIINKNNKLFNTYSVVYSDTQINAQYNKVIQNIQNITQDAINNNSSRMQECLESQMDLAYKIVEQINSNKIKIDEASYKKLITDILAISDDYKELYKYYVTEDTIENSTVKEKLNEVIDKYNNNTDIDLSKVTDLINTTREIYNTSINTDNVSDNYLNKQRILKTCEIINLIIDNDIKKAADEDSNNVTITYNVDVNTLTNQDVYVTINLPTDKAIIANNEQNAPYIFKENGTKTITINIRGYEYTYNISVKNIDKTAPKIDNVEQLNNSVTPQISDDNLQNVELKLDGNLKLEYQVGQTITTPGMYNLTAKDKAGNVTITNFIIYDTYNENNQKINYIPIYNVTTLKNLKNNINMKYTITKNNQEINENDYISAGCEIQINNKKYYLIVKGDINGDGKVTGTDLVKVRRYLIGLETFTPVEKVGAILSQRNDVSINDLAKMRKIILQ